MSFFNDLGKKITDTTHNVVEKTKTSTDTMRLNGMINDEERNINAAYLNIGKKYVELHADHAEPEFTEFFAAITESQKKISEYRDQIRKNKHLLICQSCGAEIPETVLFCTKCGAENPVGKRLAEERAAQEAAERAAREAAAAQQQAAAQQYAAQQAAAQQAAAQQTYAQAQPAAAPANTEFCTNCGKPRMAGAMFCTGCGTRFVPAEAPVSAAPAAPVPTAPAVPEAVPATPEAAPTPVNEEPSQETAPTVSTEATPIAAAETPVSTAAETIVENPADTANEETAPAETPAPSEVKSSEPQAPQKKVCPVCGRDVPPQNRFCTNCGTKVSD